MQHILHILLQSIEQKPCNTENYSFNKSPQSADDLVNLIIFLWFFCIYCRSYPNIYSIFSSFYIQFLEQLYIPFIPKFQNNYSMILNITILQ